MRNNARGETIRAVLSISLHVCASALQNPSRLPKQGPVYRTQTHCGYGRKEEREGRKEAGREGERERGREGGRD